MSQVARSRIAWAIAIGSVALVLASILYSALFGYLGSHGSEWSLTLTILFAAVAFGGTGALIAGRTGNAVGWALLSVIATLSLFLATQAYATYSFIDGEPLPLGSFAAWACLPSFFLALALIVAVPLLYPNGTPRWRPVWWAYVVSVVVVVAGLSILPGGVNLLRGQIPNPYAIEAWENIVGPAVAVAAFTILGCAVLSVVALILLARESDGIERQQVRWLAAVGIAAVVAFVLMIVSSVLLGDDPAPGPPSWVADFVFLSFVWIILFGIPVACGIAILRYHLYDLDLVVRKTVIVTVVMVTLLLLYLGVLALATVGDAPRLVVGGVLLIVTFRPVLQAARSIADRLAYGKRANAYEVLTRFSGHVGETFATEDVLPRMARILAEGAGASSARVLLRSGTTLRSVASWPDEVEPGPDEHLTPVIDRGEELGSLGVTMPANDPWDASRERLVRDLASQAGLVLRNVTLIEELRASRQRLVAAQDQERRKIERDIHDGVQQQLVALAVKLRLVDQLIDRDPAKAHEALAGLQGDATAALENLRDLARGIYPPLLADQGLEAALTAQARKAAVPTTVTAVDIGRFPSDVEAAVYFCTLEALNNAAKYSGATAVVVSLERSDGHLSFSIADDGSGFEPSASSGGTGLQGMRDRIDALGGHLLIDAAPGRGVAVTATLPAGSP